ncbi:protein lifeguard 1-like [Anopheles nili]|uniref:protein lifeguard 1-like n=1 Tax=Anopheles nili TaxID=185578 RepID=UPI00237A402A|nr:protein lifeguard 1-like [Anopheles nili]XP_053675917.1 protein lifeguard 1-like [Anopheles nili]
MAYQGGYYQDPNQAYYGAQYPPQPGYNPNYPPQQPGYPPQQPGYPPQQPGYPPQQPGYPPAGYPSGGYMPGYPPQQPQGYSPQPGFVQPPPGMPGAYGAAYDPETGSVKGFEFNDQSIRRGFIRKVYSILTVQLMITLGFITLFLYHRPTKLWVQNHPEMFWIALGVMVVTLISMACCGDVRRKAPMNFIFLTLFTLAQAFLLGVTTANFSSQEVMLAVGITAAVCLGLTLFAFQTKWDFTVMGGILFVAVLILMLFGLIAIFFPGKTITLVYASAGALIFSIYLVYDTQLMLGGEHKYSISPEEYIFAALNLYLDIVNIFLYILTIIGATRD